MLLPHTGPFENLEDFSELTGQPGSGNMDVAGGERRALLNTVLGAITVARPRSVLGLPPVIRHHVKVSFKTSSFSVMKIRKWTSQGMDLIKRGAAQDESRLKNMGLAFLRRAQAEAASPLLHVTSRISGGLPLNQVSYPEDDKEIEVAIQEWREEMEVRGDYVDLECLSDEHFKQANGF
ncbi:hypothetical protein IL306_001829 [Fusarium sp. DS 682]|nr:hypothetical protein IL306_001829 [Fusarium sp. DS 682]